jgi:BirA family transcriptional regulator, biotin operon repressor / biotin---[acetyl-CoA-carboxylase] ligase
MARCEVSNKDAQLILAETFVRTVEHHPELGSTNDRANERILPGNVTLPLLVWTDKQTAGRGRGKNRWWSEEGSLTFSVVTDELTSGTSPGQDSRIALAAGLAVAKTLAALAPGQSVQLKWPNDVWINGEKVCGILVEIPAFRSDAAIIGIGLNVNNSALSLPDDVRGKATSLSDVMAKTFHKTEVLTAVLLNLGEQLQLLQDQGDQLQNRWNPHCALRGRFVRIQCVGREFAGECRGIDSTGALLLREGDSIQKVISGVVVEIGER